MEVHFSLTPGDLWHFILFGYVRHLRRGFLRPVPLLLFGVAIVLLVPFFSGSSFSLQSLQPIGIGVLAGALIGIVFPLVRLRRVVARGAGRDGEHTVRITSEGVRRRTAVGSSATAWRGIKAVTQDKHNLYLLLDGMDPRALMAVVIPRRAFMSSRDAETFLGLARQYWTQGRGVLRTPRPGVQPDTGQETSADQAP